MKEKRIGKRILSVLLAALLVVAVLPVLAIPVGAATDGDYEYKVLDEAAKTCEITKYKGAGGAVEIPSRLGGCTVTSIGSYSFWGCTGLTAITIPDGVTDIRERAFWNCTGLTLITIPDGVTNIGDWAFSDCTGLTAIDVDENNPNYASADGVLFNKDKTTLIQCPGGKQGSYAIPDSVTGIGEYAFKGCKGLTAINMDANNPNYASVDGVLFNKDKTELIQYPAAKEGSSYIIPDSVTDIGPHAFYKCTGLTSITIPDGVTDIGGWAFCDTAYYNDEANWKNSVLYMGNSRQYLIKAKDSLSGAYKIKKGTRLIADSAFSCCKSLTSITIPDGVTKIGEYAFSDCGNLTIRGSAGSHAEACASENGIPFEKVTFRDKAGKKTDGRDGEQPERGSGKLTPAVTVSLGTLLAAAAAAVVILISKKKSVRKKIVL